MGSCGGTFRKHGMGAGDCHQHCAGHGSHHSRKRARNRHGTCRCCGNVCSSHRPGGHASVDAVIDDACGHQSCGGD